MHMKFSVGKTEGKKPCTRPVRGSEGNIKLM